MGGGSFVPKGGRTMQSRIDLLGAVSRNLIGQRYSNHTVHEMLYGLREAIGAKAAVILRQDPVTEYLRICSHFHVSSHAVRVFERGLGRGIFARVFLKDPLVVIAPESDADAHAELLLDDEFHTAVVARLAAHERAFGCLVVYFDHDVRGDHDVVSFVSTCAHLAALAIEKEELLGSLRELRQNDAETGHLTYAYFYRRLGEELARCERTNHPLSIMLLDIDNFKAVISEHGLETARRLCREVGRSLKELVREVDVIARYGIDEFVIYAPETGMDEAQIMCDRFLEKVKSGSFTEQRIRTTLSVGIATYRHGDTLHELLWRAQKALHAARVENHHTAVSKD
jgi:diguanylate cyclase (GGDEF)-like protein